MGGVDGESHGGEGHAPSTERWLLTYSDMITLLMVFFIILYAFSKTSAAKYEAIAESLHAALSGGPMTRGLPQASANALVSLSPNPTSTQQVGVQPANTLLLAMGEQLQQVLQNDAAIRDDAAVQISPTGVDLSFEGDAVYFESASARLTPAFMQVLSAVAPVLKETTDAIQV